MDFETCVDAVYYIKVVMEALERKYGELLRSREQRAREIMKKGEYFSESISDNGQPHKDMISIESLEVVENDMQNTGKKQNLHELYSYTVEGQGLVLYVSDLYLQQRVNSLSEDSARTDRNVYTMLAEQEEDKGERRYVRYFDGFKKQEGMRYSRCFRCGKPGHSIKHCVFDQEPIKCMFCLGNHSHNSCNTRTCFQCNQMGHIAKECKNSRLRCSKCGNKGHSQPNCGVVIFLNHSKIKLDRNFREKYGCDDILNLRCLAHCKYPVGHFNCHEYLNDKEQCYSQAKAEKTIQREKYILSNFNKLREIYFKQKGNRPAKAAIKPALPPCDAEKMMQEEIQCSQ